MKLYLYQNRDDEKKVFKNIATKSPIFTLENIQWKEDTDILKPTFTFHKSAIEGGANLPAFNYCRLEWNGYYIDRYFFIDDIIAQKGGIIELVCRQDVRFTWRNWIGSQHYLIARQENICDYTLPDERKKIPLARQLESLGFTGGDNNGEVGDGGNGTIMLTVSG